MTSSVGLAGRRKRSPFLQLVKKKKKKRISLNFTLECHLQIRKDRSDTLYFCFFEPRQKWASGFWLCQYVVTVAVFGLSSYWVICSVM